MKTRHKDSVLFLSNGTAICCYCGKELKVEYKSEWDEYYEDRWTEYECCCKDWDNAIEMNNEIAKLNWVIYEQFCDYERKFRNLANRKYKVNFKKYDLK